MDWSEGSDGAQTVFWLEPDAEHCAPLMQSMVGNCEFAARARAAGPRHVHARYGWARVVDRLIEAIG